MHIAICDDNVGDRKQLERLLERECDKRMSTTGVLYTDSFGSAQVMLGNPMQYDVFYIDICNTEGINGIDVVNMLTEHGVNAPIVMCCSDINYREYSFPKNVIFLDKPIRVSDLAASLEHAQEIKSNALPLIELREEKETTYVSEPDIIYAIEKGRTVQVTLMDGKKLSITTNAFNFFSHIENYSSFFAPTTKIILNARHIENIGFHKVTMVDGASFKVRGKSMLYAKLAFEEIHGQRCEANA